MAMLDLLRSAGSFWTMFDLVLSKPIALALERWHRRSELSADRAGFIGCQDSDVALSALMKLAGGSVVTRFGLPDAAEFLRQSRRYHKVTLKGMNRAYSWIVNTESDHPQPVARATEMIDWSRSRAFHELVAARTQRWPRITGRPLM
jgi:Zn-dependent protease with chaperone function